MTVVDTVGWIPVRLSWLPGGAEVEWRDLGTRCFREPFFEDTVRAALSDPACRRTQTSLAALREAATRSPGVPPAGFIFHLSRCGSTLVAQALAALPHAIVLSEAPPIDSVVRAAGLGPEERVRWLIDVIGALGRRRRGDEQRLFVKFDCWTTVDLPLVKRAFPDVPWLFVYRDPIEVMVSHARQPGRHMVPDVLPSRLFGIEPDDAAAMPSAIYGARVLAAICQAAIAHYDPERCRLVNYTELPMALSRIARFFGVDPSEFGALDEVIRRDAKNPARTFVDDTSAKRRAATPAVLTAVDTYVMARYQHLEDLRRCTPA